MNYCLDWLDFEFGETIQCQINILNASLRNLGKLPILENNDFIVDKESAGTFFLRISLSNSNNRGIPIDFLLEGDGLRLDIFHLPESFEWSKNQIEKEQKDIELFIEKLLTSYLLIESRYSISRKSQICFFDDGGNLTDKYKLRGGLNLLDECNCEKKLFLPIYKL